MERKLKKPGETERKLNAIFHRMDRVELAKIWNVDGSTVSKRLDSQLRMTLEEFASVLDFAGVQVTGSGEVTIDEQELQLLEAFAYKALKAKMEGRT